MEWLETAVVVVHVLVSLGLVGLVLLQQGKGAEAGASFGGGASQTVFGSQGTGSFLTRTTSYLAVIFFVTSISLAVLAKQKAEVAADEAFGLAPVAEQSESGSEDENKAALEEPVVSKEETIELEAAGAGDADSTGSAAPELE